MSTFSQLQRLEKTIIRCNNCSRLREVTPIPYPHIYYGDPEKLDIFILMRNSGLEHSYEQISLKEFFETYKKNWLVCKVGKYLENILGKDFILNRMFFANICKCSSPNNSKLESEEIKNCKKFFDLQLEIIKPKMLLSFGSEANSFIKEYKSTIPYYTFYHPSAFSYNYDEEKYNKQMNQLRKLINE